MSGENPLWFNLIMLALGILLLTYLLYRHRPREIMESKFEIFKDKKQKFRFRLIAPNGEIICQSEGYESKQACTDTMAVLGTWARDAKTVDLT